ncbi:hypothetical protein B0H14DRAFT_2624595 [Mycena olivaceomarginata]|nr:hypothetical protein B0H14DRAFT_2624595 [Mycena olivaceomarginata]
MTMFAHSHLILLPSQMSIESSQTFIEPVDGYCVGPASTWSGVSEALRIQYKKGKLLQQFTCIQVTKLTQKSAVERAAVASKGGTRGGKGRQRGAAVGAAVGAANICGGGTFPFGSAVGGGNATT